MMHAYQAVGVSQLDLARIPPPFPNAISFPGTKQYVVDFWADLAL